MEAVEFVASHYVEEPLDGLFIEKMPHDVKMRTAIRKARSVFYLDAGVSAVRILQLAQRYFGVEASGIAGTRDGHAVFRHLEPVAFRGNRLVDGKRNGLRTGNAPAQFLDTRRTRHNRDFAHGKERKSGSRRKNGKSPDGGTIAAEFLRDTRRFAFRRTECEKFHWFPP